MILNEDFFDDNVVIDGNKLIIKKDFDKDNIVLKRHNYTNKEFFLYTSGNSQKMMSSGGITNSTSNLNINLISGSIEIEKLDKETLSINPQGPTNKKHYFTIFLRHHFN